MLLLDGCEALDFFFFFGGGSVTADIVSLESVDAVAFSSAGCLLSDDDFPALDVEEFVDDDADPDVLDGSADATPCPTKTAAPIPRAAASPPIRPPVRPSTHAYVLTVDKRVYVPSTSAPRLRLERIGLDCVAEVNFDAGCGG
jgi:hypothetical protein